MRLFGGVGCDYRKSHHDCEQIMARPPTELHIKSVGEIVEQWQVCDHHNADDRPGCHDAEDPEYNLDAPFPVTRWVPIVAYLDESIPPSPPPITSPHNLPFLAIMTSQPICYFMDRDCESYPESAVRKVDLRVDQRKSEHGIIDKRLKTKSNAAH